MSAIYRMHEQGEKFMQNFRREYVTYSL